MDRAKSLEAPLALRLASGLGLGVWVLVAAFPLFWIAAMSFKLPLDAFSARLTEALGRDDLVGRAPFVSGGRA